MKKDNTNLPQKKTLTKIELCSLNKQKMKENSISEEILKKVFGDQVKPYVGFPYSSLMVENITSILSAISPRMSYILT